MVHHAQSLPLLSGAASCSAADGISKSAALPSLTLESMRVFFSTSIFMGKNHDNTNSLTSAAAERNQWWWPLEQLFLGDLSQFGIKDIIRSRQVTWATLPPCTALPLQGSFQVLIPLLGTKCARLMRNLWVQSLVFSFPQSRKRERAVAWILYLKIMNIFVALCD